ncbi:MAG: hypothetical protein OXG34_14990 [bacterium]|nr:hypothetical protein [bacterium]MCY3889622.1 hypothetical protein [bacterium]MCY3962946.1 hypothetical protein [bacterium]MCY4134635.1 hypothetical protein [bacterium]
MIHFPEGTVIAEVVNQDLDGIGRVQAGMASNGIEQLLLGNSIENPKLGKSLWRKGVGIGNNRRFIP